MTLAHGLAIGDTVESGGEAIIQRGGVDVDITIASGGTGIVSRGGAIIVDRGETLVIWGLLINSGTVTAKDTGVLVLAGSVENAGSIRAIGVAARIDLDGVTISGGTLVTHGAAGGDRDR